MENKIGMVQTYIYADYTADIIKMKNEIAVAEQMNPIFKKTATTMEKDVVGQMCSYMLSACCCLNEFPREVFNDIYSAYRKAGDSTTVPDGSKVKIEMGIAEEDTYLIHVCNNYNGFTKVIFKVMYSTNECHTVNFPDSNKIDWLVKNWEHIKGYLNQSIENTIEVYRKNKTANTDKVAAHIDCLREFCV